MLSLLIFNSENSLIQKLLISARVKHEIRSLKEFLIKTKLEN